MVVEFEPSIEFELVGPLSHDQAMGHLDEQRSEDRRGGGHVLDLRPRRAHIKLDPSGELHLELPPGVELSSPELGEATRRATERVEADF